MKIYFAGSISGGRERLKDYQMISESLSKWGEVLPRAVSRADVLPGGEDIQAAEIFRKETKWIELCDAFVLEATQPSFGVGFQTAQALSLGKPSLALYRRDHPISALLLGSGIPYEAWNEKRDLEETLRIFLG